MDNSNSSSVGKTQRAAKCWTALHYPLVEADFNMVLKILFGRRMVYHAKENKFIPAVQFWILLEWPATVPCSLKLSCMTYFDSSDTTPVCSTMTQRDATIASSHPLGMLACMHLGMPHAPALALLKFLYAMKYKIHTVLGLTEECFSNQVYWILGSLQGSGASPCIWLALSIVLLAGLSQKSPGVTLVLLMD